MCKIEIFLTTQRNNLASLSVKELLKFWINGLFYILFCSYFCCNKSPMLEILKIAVKKLAVLLLIAVFAIASFATLGDGNKKSSLPKKSLLSSKTVKQGVFSLRSGYTFRGNQVINTQIQNRYISLNTTVTYQKGNTTYIVPLKKKVILNNVKIDLGNRQLRRN